MSDQTPPPAPLTERVVLLDFYFAGAAQAVVLVARPDEGDVIDEQADRWILTHAKSGQVTTIYKAHVTMTQRNEQQITLVEQMYVPTEHKEKAEKDKKRRAGPAVN